VVLLPQEHAAIIPIIFALKKLKMIAMAIGMKILTVIVLHVKHHRKQDCVVILIIRVATIRPNRIVLMQEERGG